MTPVRLTRSGGFAGITKAVSSADLPDDVRAEVETLAENVGPQPDPPLAVPDSFIYRLQVGEREFMVPEHAVPPDLQPLLERLKPHLR